MTPSHTHNLTCFSSEQAKDGMETITGCSPEPSASRGYVTCRSFMHHVLTKVIDWKESFGFPDFQLEFLLFTLDFAGTALSQAICFYCYQLFVLFLSQHLYISFCFVLSTHFKPAGQINKPKAVAACKALSREYERWKEEIGQNFSLTTLRVSGGVLGYVFSENRTQQAIIKGLP
ncbi:hypothetical protein VULLAG_LOCUS11983 [Vulpes lagopus]